jgi:hypothetical protein
MKWKQLKHKPETLVDMVNELGTRGVGDRFNKNKDTINHWLKKYGYEYDPSTHKWGKEGETEEEEVDLDEFEEYLNQKGKAKVSKTENGYKINKDNAEVDLSKEELKQIYYDYCELGITKKETAVKNGFILDDLELILKTFGIVHKELPVTEEEILEKDPKQIVQQIIQNKKRKIKEMKPAEEMRYLRKLADKHLKDDYYTDRVIEEMKKDLRTIKIELDDLEITYSKEDNVLVVVLSDWHYGKKVLKEQLLGDNEYNSSIFKERIDKYRKKIIEEIKLRNPQKVIIVNLGDIADDPQSRTYPGQVHNQDVTGEKQVLQCAKHLTEFILGIRKHHDKVEVYGVTGNHSDDTLNADALILGITGGWLEGTDILVDTKKRDFKVVKLLNSNLVFTHGNNLRGGTNTKENDILNIIHALNLQGKNTYIINGHLHHESGEGVNYERKGVPSLVGNDNYSQNQLNVSSRPAQMFFLIDRDGMTGRNKVYFD